MLNQYPHYQDHKNAQVIKMYTWLAYDIGLTGLFVYNWMILQVQTFATAVDAAEKFILFLCTVTFAGYRIYIMHREAEKKTLENRQLRDELKRKAG